MGYNPELETKYYSKLPKEKRIETLVEQQTTVVAEANLNTFQRTYQWQDFSVTDEISGERVGDLVIRGGIKAEYLAWQGIEAGLDNENVTVLNFSPANDSLNYPGSAIDLWRRKGEEVTWTRVTISDGFEKMVDIYKGVSGEVEADPLQMLAKPIVVENNNIAGILDKFRIIKEGVNFNIEDIRNVVEIIVKDFVIKFGEDFMLNEEKVYRSFSAAIDEVSGWKNKVTQRIAIGLQRLYDYAYAPMVNIVTPTYGCDKQNTVGRFVNSAFSWFKRGVETIKSIFIEKTFDCPRCHYKIESGKGIEECPDCGLTKQQAGSTCG